VILDGAQLVLDTNILVHLLRGKQAGQVIERRYEVSQRSPRAIAYKLDWGIDKRATLGAMLAGLPAADISHRAVHDAYADLDFRSMSIGIKMGENSTT
jgi:predicted nucleic acid-binding protein